VEVGRTLVLLPGLDGTEAFLRPLAEAIAPSCSTLCVCYPESDVLDYEDALAIARRATAGLREFYLLGLSFSGPVAVMLAAEEPGRVKGVILAASFLRAPRRGLAFLRLLCRGPVLLALRLLHRIPDWILRRPGDRVRRAKAEVWARVSSRCMASRVRAILRVDVRETLRKCRQPVLCVSFMNDRVVPRVNAEEIRRAAPAATAVVIPGGHFSGCMNGRALADAVVNFMDRYDSV
jgi:pimeloyl-ACP methyl ester carboxylesterase